MRRFVLIGSLLAIASLAGCLAEETAEPPAAEPAEAGAGTERWSLRTEGSVGWTAGAGQWSTVGVEAGISDCYSLRTWVPETAEQLTVAVEAEPVDPEGGVGSYEIEFENDEGTHLEGPLVEPTAFTFEQPVDGAWLIHARVSGATVDQYWTVEVAQEGQALDPPDELRLRCA